MENEILENYFENTIIPQLYVDGNLILRKFTPPAMKQFSLSLNDLGKSIVDLKDNIRYPTFLDNINEVIETRTKLEKEIQTTDMRWFQMNILPYLIRKENRINGVIITFVDITRRINNLKDLEKLNVDHATFTYSVSHDIRQPLSTLSLLAEAFEDSFVTKDEVLFRANLEIQKRCITNISKIVDGLAHQAKNRNEVFGNNERVNIEDIWEDITLALKDEIFKNNAIITTDFATSEILFSRINLRSIVYNILYNAIKYREDSRQLKIHASTEKTDKEIILRIADNGIGIAAENYKSIFHEHSRVSKEGEGRGIGLYLVKTMMENNDGKIDVISSVGEGSTFIACFPA